MVTSSIAAALLFITIVASLAPGGATHGDAGFAALREEAIARFPPQVRDVLAAVPVQLSPRPLPRTVPTAAACFDPRTGVVTIGDDIEREYGRAFALSALMHEYGHALALHSYGWDLREFRKRFVSAMSLVGVERAYPAFTRFVQRHYTELMTTSDYSEIFPSLLLEMRSADIVPPPLRPYVAAVMWK